MKNQNPISDELLAPCGINCALCSRYLAGVNNLKRNRCSGCRPRNQRCTYLFAKCSGLNHAVLPGQADFCFECDQYPCRQIDRIEKRYTTNYNVSVKDNLAVIKNKGIDTFIDEQYRKHHCPKCGGLVSMHNRKCFHCDTISRLVDKEK